MIGAIAGDIVGSRFERNPIKTKDFQLFHPMCRFTDDSVMSLAVAQALILAREDLQALARAAADQMRRLGRLYPDRGYGGNFARWLTAAQPRPYGSFGNGAAMRVGPCGFAASSLDEALLLARTVTAVSHDHPEAIKAAEATAGAIFLARQGQGAQEIRHWIGQGHYSLDFTLDQIRPGYRFDSSCQGSVPQALTAALEAASFEEALRSAVSLGGDSDTLACIAGSLAEARFGVPEEIRRQAEAYLEPEPTLKNILKNFESRWGGGAEGLKT